MADPQITMEGDTLVIRVDCSEAALRAAPPSKSGKTRVVASTNGFVKCGQVSVGLNVVTK